MTKGNPEEVIRGFENWLTEIEGAAERLRQALNTLSDLLAELLGKLKVVKAAFSGGVSSQTLTQPLEDRIEILGVEKEPTETEDRLFQILEGEL